MNVPASGSQIKHGTTTPPVQGTSWHCFTFKEFKYKWLKDFVCVFLEIYGESVSEAFKCVTLPYFLYFLWLLS